MSLNYLAPAWQAIHPNWQQFLTKNCYSELLAIDQQLSAMTKSQTIYPPRSQILRALNQAPHQIRVVILGQDPYHGAGEANGLAFAINPGIKTPPSLRNIFKELVHEYYPAVDQLDSQLLNSWAQQGVMLLNSCLSVLQDQANSLAGIGWSTITDLVISHISQTQRHCVFMLWGNYARHKKSLIDANQHLILETTHPSPLSARRGFLGCNHFRQANEYLDRTKRAQINWLNNLN